MSILQNPRYQDTAIFNKEVIKLFYFLNIENYNQLSCIFDAACSFKGFHILYLGSKDETEINLRLNKNFYRSIMQYSKPMHYYRFVLTIPNTCYYRKNFLIEYKKTINKNFYIWNIPMDRDQTTILNNELTNRPWGREEEGNSKFYELNHNFSRVELKYQSFVAKGAWKFPFQKNLTKERRFYNGPIKYNLPIEITTMTCVDRNLVLKSHYNKKLKCFFVDIPYANDEYSMLIIKPDQTFVRNKLLEFCLKYFSGKGEGGEGRWQEKEEEEDIILNFYHKHGKFTKYQKMTLPKFHVESEYHLDEEEILKKRKYVHNCNYLPLLFGETPPNLRHISNELENEEELRFSFYSEFICDEDGISQPPPKFHDKIKCIEDDDNDNDDDYDKERKNDDDNDNDYNKKFIVDFEAPLFIDNNFIYAIMEKKYTRIIALGIFEGQ